MIKTNPYRQNGGSLSPEMFFDRCQVASSVVDSFVAEPMYPVALYGQRYIGKTSLVRHISRSSTLQQMGVESSNSSFVYFDCQKHYQALNGIDTIYKALFDQLRLALPPPLRDSIGSTTATEAREKWDYSIPLLSQQGVHVHVIFDDFDLAIFQERLQSEGFFGSIRSYLDPDLSFSWITCTSRPIAHLFVEAFQEYRVSPQIQAIASNFYGVTKPYVLNLFEENDIDRLINEPSTAHGVEFSDEDKKTIKSFGGRFPYFIQLACHHFFNAHIRKDVQRGALLQQCVKEVRQLWESYWNKLGSDQQRFLSAAAEGRHTYIDDTQLEVLKDAALLYGEYNHYHLFSEQFAQFVRSKSPRRSSTVVVDQDIYGQYKVIKIAGETNHSQVVKAWDGKLERHVAIKLLHTSDEMPGENSAFLQELLKRGAKITNNLPYHPNIGRIYVMAEEPLSIIMEWIEGVPLEEFIDTHHAKLPVEKVVEVGMKVADALGHVHSHGVTHRDIKPNNIILTHDRGPVLIDFDIARAGDQATLTRGADGSLHYVGYPPYSAPEQFLREGHVGPAADLFSLGVVLYRLLTHQAPYEWGNNLSDHLDRRFPELPRWDIPEPLYKILCMMLSGEPGDRLSARDIRDRLGVILESMKEASVSDE